MYNELLYAPIYVAPTQEELRSMLGGAYAGCKAIRDFVQANYKVEERWRYSDMRDAFDCLMYNGERRLCSLHLREGRLSLLVMLSAEECARLEARKEGLCPTMAENYLAAEVRDGVRWLRVPLEGNASLEDIFALLRLKADLIGMESAWNESQTHGDEGK